MAEETRSASGDGMPPHDRTVFELDISGATPPKDPIRRQVPYLDVEAGAGDDAREFEPAHQRKLRLALAMRGGVSLAVWIGGAVAEIDLWRRIRIRRRVDGSVCALYLPPDADDAALDQAVHERAVVYARLLDSAQFDAVEVDVQAGASAGGLNAVMYAVAQRAGADVDQLLQTWVDVGGIWELMQRPGLRSIDSVLRGDDYFFPGVRDALTRFYLNRRSPLHRANRLTVDLSATVADSEDAVDRGTKEGRGHFHFVASPDDPDTRERGRAIPAPASTTREEDLARLALAARSTSSFPGAFEPALIFSRATGPLGALGAKPLGDGNAIDMSFAFHAHREDWDHPFRVVDGGVLDNVPIDRAFRAIRTMASEVNTARAMIYLDPDPPARSLRSIHPLRYGPAGQEPASGPRSLRLPRFADRQSVFLAAIGAGRGKRGISESGADEEDAIEQYRLQQLLAQARNRALAPLANAAQEYPLQEARAAYLSYRASADPQLFSPILISPSLWQLSTNLTTREVWTGWSEEERSVLPGNFQRHYTDLVFSGLPEQSTDARALLLGPQALVDAARSALAWIRALEDLPGELKQTSLLDLDLQRPVRSLADVRLRLYGALSAAIDARDRSVRSALQAVQALRAADGDPTVLRDNIAVTLRTTWLRASHEDKDLKALWQRLDDGVIALRALSEAQAETDAADAWEREPWSGAPQRTKGFHAVDLAPFTAVMGVPEAVPQLTYWKITADERPVHPDRYRTLNTRRLRQATAAALTLRPEDLDREVTRMLFSDHNLMADDKLAGTSLFHFAGFLAKAWRANDWWWGRLDASAGMIRFVASLIPPTTPENPSPGAESGGVAPEPYVERAQDAVLLQAAKATEAQPFRTSVRDVRSADGVRDAFTLGADTMDDMRPGYVFSVLSRGLRVASRALAGSLGFWQRLVVILLRPLLVFAPLTFNALREALVAAVLGVAIALVGGILVVPTGVEPGALIAGSILVVVALGVLFWSVIEPLRSWQRLGTAVRALGDEIQDSTWREIRQYRRSARWQGWIYAVASLVTLAVTTAALWIAPTTTQNSNGSWSLRWGQADAGMGVPFWILLVSALVLALRSRLRFRTPNESPHRHGLYWSGVCVYTAWIVIVLALPALAHLIPGPHHDSVPLIAGVTGLVLAVLLTWGWLVLRGSRRANLLNSVTVSLACGVVAWVAVRVLFLTAEAWQWNSVLATMATVIVALFAWGTLLWWLPELPEGRTAPWRLPPMNSELRKGIADRPV